MAIILLSILISGCGASETVSRLSILPELMIENEKMNTLIVNRKPDYGYDGLDGCKIMGEISMDIKKLINGKHITGMVLDAQDKTPLVNAGILIFVSSNGIRKPIETLSDNNGIFDIEFDGEIREIIVADDTCRTLKIDFDKV